MGQRSGALVQRAAAARRRLRERTLPALTTALALQISIASARRSYDLRALSSAFGLIVLLALALAAATLDGLLTSAALALREIGRVRVRFGPAAPIVVAPPPAITEDMLFDKRGRPLRGAARARRIEAIERERALLAPVMAPLAPHVIALPDPRTHPVAKRLIPPLAAAFARSRPAVVAAYRGALPLARALRALALAVYRRSLWAAALVRALPVPGLPVPTLSLRWLRAVAITTTMTFVFATAIGTTGFIAQQGSIALGASTTLSIISGEVTARTADSADFRTVSDGDLLRAGMTIRTGPDTYAVLTYFEGSTVSLEPNTTVVIESLESHPDGTTVISMQQQVGRTWHSVAKLLNPGSRYEVRTPGLTATVRGTAFEVGVEQDASGEVVSSVVTTEGAVGAAKPPTAAEPAPPEVIVPAGFQTAAKRAEPVAPAEPAPEPERKVTVTVGSSNAVVVDPLGRANGERDGKLVLQTPGAKVQKVDGKLVVTLPKLPDGKISTVITPASRPTTQVQAPPGPVSVVTVVSERGKGDARSEETVQVPASPSAPAVVTGVEVKRSDSAQPAEVRVLAPAEKQSAPAPKLAEPPKRKDAPKTELLPAAPEKTSEPEKGKSEGGDAAKVSAVIDVIVKATLPPLSIEDAGRRTEEARKAEEKAKEEAAKREEQRRRDNEQRAEELRRAEERAKDEAARLTDERRRAEQRAREQAARDEERRRAEQAGRGGGPGTQLEGSRETPQGAGGLLENILKVIAPSAGDEAQKRAEEARKAEDKANDEVTKVGEERRKAEDTTRQDDIKRTEETRKSAEQRGDELRKAEEKAKEDSAKELQRVREIEQRAREQAQKLEADKRGEAEKRIDEFRRGEEKAREDAARRLEEQRRAEEKAKDEAERRLEQLRRQDDRSREEGARAAEERQREQREREEKRRSEEKAREERGSGRFTPVQTIDPLPGRLGANDARRGSSGR